MEKSMVKANNIVWTEEVWAFIKEYFNLLYDDVVKVSYEYKAGERSKCHYMNIDRVNSKEVMEIKYDESDEFVIALLKKFNLHSFPVTSLKFSIDYESVPVFDMGVYPYINRGGTSD